MSIKNINKKIDALVIEKRPFIDGVSYETSHSKVINKISPADGRDLSGLSACQQEDIDIAVHAAKKSFDSKIWSDTALREKKEVIFRLADLLEKNKEELSLLDTVETGRAYKNFYYDSIPKAIETLRYFAECIDKCYDLSISPSPDASAIISREPLGVVGIITPWNDPMVVSMWKVAPALLMGNSVVIKPAEQSSFSILLVARLAKEAGLPDGVLNVVTGTGEIAGRALAIHHDVAGIFFTGSSEVGKNILQYSGQSNMKKVGLECGGKSPYLVSKNCNDLYTAAKVLAKNMFYNQGQICSAPSRAIIDKSILEKFVKLLLVEIEKYVPNDPYDADSNVGCVISEQQKDRIQHYINIGQETGAKMYEASAPADMNKMSQYITPTIFVTDDYRSVIAQEEIFGPVLVVISTPSMTAAVDIANQSRYGLAASIWTNDLDEAHWVSRALQAGIVHINSYGDDDNSVPFGGIKESGIGKDKSIYAFDEYSYLKTTWTHHNNMS